MSYLLIVGLGNPGAQFATTRHNLGIRIVRSWTRSLPDYLVDPTSPPGVWQRLANLQAEVFIVNEKAVCLFPVTMMNESGRAVAAAVKHWQVKIPNIIVVHDDMNIPFGKVAVKAAGSAGGHRGVISIHRALGTQEITRLRVGIGRPPTGVDPKDFVLDNFSPEEEQQLPSILSAAADKITAMVKNRRSV